MFTSSCGHKAKLFQFQWHNVAIVMTSFAIYSVALAAAAAIKRSFFALIGAPLIYRSDAHVESFPGGRFFSRCNPANWHVAG